MNERREQGVRTRDRTSGTWTKVIAGERGEEISQVVDFAAGQNFGELQPVWTSRISSCSRCLCRGITPPGGMSSVPSTRCFEPLFWGVTFRMNSAVGMGSDPSGRRTRASPSFFSSTRVLAPSDCAAQMAAERTTTTSGIIRFILGTVYRDTKGVNKRHIFNHVSRLPLKTERTDKCRKITIALTTRF